jgi:hypothetical protein
MDVLMEMFFGRGNLAYANRPRVFLRFPIDGEDRNAGGRLAWAIFFGSEAGVNESHSLFPQLIGRIQNDRNDNDVLKGRSRLHERAIQFCIVPLTVT